MFVDQVLEVLIGGDVLLNGGDLFARNIFGDVLPVFTVLEIVVWLTVWTGADDR